MTHDVGPAAVDSAQIVSIQDCSSGDCVDERANLVSHLRGTLCIDCNPLDIIRTKPLGVDDGVARKQYRSFVEREEQHQPFLCMTTAAKEHEAGIVWNFLGFLEGTKGVRRFKSGLSPSLGETVVLREGCRADPTDDLCVREGFELASMITV